MNSKTKLSKIIFNTKFSIFFTKNNKYYKTIIKELKLYPNFKEKSDINIFIDIKKKPIEEFEFKSNVFNISKSYFDICWVFNKTNVKEIIINTKYKHTNFLIKFKDYFFNKDLSFPEKLFVKDLHELVLVPTQFFNLKNTIVHGSCVTFNNKNKLFGGLGGVGKTSALLKFSNNKSYFFSDDMTIIDLNKKIHPNYAYPKIYAYNLKNNKKISKYILSDLNFIKKFLFYVIGKINGSFIRKRINPSLFYLIKKHEHINFYYLLDKSNKNNFLIKSINSEKISILSWKIIEIEYAFFIANILKHDYKCKLYNCKNYFNYNKLLKNKLTINNLIFKSSNNFLINIPNNMKHEEYLTKIEKKIKNN